MNLPFEAPRMPSDVYHAHEALSSTAIKEARKSLAHFKAYQDGRKHVSKSTRSSFDLGNAAHEVNLEGTMDGFVLGPDVSSKAVKEWKSFVEANPDKIVLTPEEYCRVLQMREAFASHPRIPSMMRDCKIEHSYFSLEHQTGLALKARPDALGEDYIIDYKTTSLSISERSFSHTIENLGYHISAAHYMDVIKSVTGKPIKDFFFIVQETTMPYAIRLFRLSPPAIQRGLSLRAGFLGQIQNAIKTNNYPGYETAISEIDLPWFVYQAEAFEAAV